MENFKNKTIIMSGGSRGVGLEIAKTLGKDGANVIILAKTTEPHPTLPGTIYTAAEEIEAVGGNALPVVCDIRFEEQVASAIAQGVEKFGGIDICINNASAIHLSDTVNTPIKKIKILISLVKYMPDNPEISQIAPDTKIPVPPPKWAIRMSF